MIDGRIPENLARGLASYLNRTDGFRSLDSGSAEHLVCGHLPDGSRIDVFGDGRFRYQRTPRSFALVTQALRGILPPPKGRFIVGIDEAGIGGEAREGKVAAVLFSAEVAADLLAEGVRDSKSISSKAELERLANLIREKCVEKWERTMHIREGTRHSTTVASEVGKLLRRLEGDGYFVRETTVRIDQLDVETLRQAVGDSWAEMEDRVEITSHAERFPEVAAASILAKNAVEPTPQSAAAREEDELYGKIFRIGRHTADDREPVLDILQNLRYKYPDIDRWIGRDKRDGLWSRIQKGDYDLTVARVGNRIAGLCLVQQKDARNAKISTFWVEPSFRGRNLGPRILQRELYRLAAKGLRRTLVTFGHEEYANLEAFFAKYGFKVDGISPQRYRDNAYEVIMGKRFHRGTIDEGDFPEFVRDDLFRLVGYDVHEDDSDFLATPRNELWAVHQGDPKTQYLVRPTTSPTPEDQIKSLKERAKDLGALPVLASLYGWPCETPLPSKILVLDAYSIGTDFFPIHLERPEGKDVVVPIRPRYAERLFPINPQQSFKFPELRLRSDHVYYRSDHGCKNLRRGDRIYFYVSGSGNQQIIGQGMLRTIKRGSPRKLHALHGGLGAWKLDEIEQGIGGETGMAMVFDWFQRFRQPVQLERIKNIRPRFNPITAVQIDHNQGDKITKEGGVESKPASSA